MATSDDEMHVKSYPNPTEETITLASVSHSKHAQSTPLYIYSMDPRAMVYVFVYNHSSLLELRSSNHQNTSYGRSQAKWNCRVVPLSSIARALLATTSRSIGSLMHIVVLCFDLWASYQLHTTSPNPNRTKSRETTRVREFACELRSMVVLLSETQSEEYV
jgi:hypothetical protein